MEPTASAPTSPRPERQPTCVAQSVTENVRVSLRLPLGGGTAPSYPQTLCPERCGKGAVWDEKG